MLPADVTRHLATRAFGRRLFYYPEVRSTNDAAMALARVGEGEGSVVYADVQTRGRGRFDHVWTSLPGRDLLFSLILRPRGDLRSVLPVTLALSVAFAVAIEKATFADVALKWPNDLHAALPRGEFAKLAGILAESGADKNGERVVVVGVGVNVNGAEGDFPPDLDNGAVSCRMLAGGEVDRALLFADILGMAEGTADRFHREGFAPFAAAYEERMRRRGARVRFERDGRVVEGDIMGVAPDGALRVSTASGEGTLYNESVEVTA